MSRYDIVVYGATMPGVATVRLASAVDEGLSILLVNPRQGWGGISCGGRQNFWDRRLWDHGDRQRLVQGGSFRAWYDQVGQAYDTSEMAQLLRTEVQTATVREQWEVTDVTTTDESIDGIELSPIGTRPDGTPELASRHQTVTADVFVDASESGRLARLASVPHTVGREDWGPDDRQMAASLLFRVGDLDWSNIRRGQFDGQQVFDIHRDPQTGKRLFWGGSPVTESGDAVASFEAEHPRCAIKPMNAAEHDDGEFWINALLVYDVDGTRTAYDDRPARSDDDRQPLDRFSARQQAEAIVDSPSFERAMRSFPGFDDATLPTDEPTDDRTANLLYLRETIHAGDGSYALGRDAVETAGTGPSTGADSDHYDHRIGLGYYWLDNNGYAPDESGPELGDAPNPVYIPYETLTAPTVDNLLTPGYAASISSEAWFSLRVLPNLCVLGDAAGVAAALAVEQDAAPSDASALVPDIQRQLKANDAILDKTHAPTLREVPADD